MRAPDKIFLHGYDFDDEPCKSWDKEPRVKGMRGYPAKHAAYIRKDLLLEWAKEEQAKCSSETHPYAMFMNVVIDKLNSL